MTVLAFWLAASSSGDGLNLQEIGGIGVGATVLLLLVRTFWRQDSRWDDVLIAERQSAKTAREDASSAREEATLARLEAADLRRELILTRDRESSLVSRITHLEEQIRLLVESKSGM
jgi:hypothetical protein